MKRLVSTFLLLFLVLTAVGQIGNEWIQYHQPYFRIPVAGDGLFKVSHSSLQLAGFPVTADPRKFQLFHRGVEQSIIVQGEADGVFNTDDFVEFYGRKNDGTLDSTLYEDPSHQPHRFYNLFTDTTSYFLTIGSSEGKRIPVHSGPSGGLTEDASVLGERLLILRDNYSSGQDYGSIQKSTFDAGEGWMGTQVLQGQERTYSLEGITSVSTSSGKPVLSMALTGRGSMFHDVEIYAGSRLLSTISFSGYETYTLTESIEWSDIDASGRLSVRIRVTGSNGTDRVSVGYLRLLFPRIASLPEAENVFYLHPNANDISLIRIQDAPAGVRIFDVTDPSSVIQLQGQVTSALDVVVPNSAEQRKILATTLVTSVSGIKRVLFRQINPAAHNYVVITHAALRKPAGGYLDPVKAFAEYRSLPEGGGFDTLVVNIDQLYDQFNYGEQSPRAIFQFMKFFASVKLPQYLFLVGKGLDVNYGYRRNPAAFTLYKDLVPTAGYPASDMAFSAGLGGSDHVPAVATGRLSANNPADVAAYFNKVKERDALPFDDLNRKKILHLSGGIEEGEPAQFSEILRGFETVAEDHYLGAKVQAIVKRSTEVKLINIAEEVNAGLGLITFFGHSAPNTFDFDIGLVTDPVMGYKNKGKYPFLLMNGCDAGSFFLNATIPGENWVTTPDKGAVGFIAHSSYGLVNGLQRYSATFYEVAFGDSVFIKKGAGMVQQEVARRYLEAYGTSALAISQIQQMVLQGDPAMKIFGAERPDYSVEAEGIYVSAFSEDPLTALTDSFRINIPLRNTGIARDVNIRINIAREFNGGQLIQYDTIVPAVLNADTVSILIRNSDNNGYGISTFTIHVDADDLVEELNESNNTATFEYFIPLNSTRNLYPYNYGIVDSRELSLSFQYTDLLADSREFLLEIDTTNTFDSGFKKQFTVSAKVLARHALTLPDQDSLVYYWRTRIADPEESESQMWAESSFTYIEGGPEGWAQMHFPQFQNNASIGLVSDPLLRRVHFEETVSDVTVRTFSTSAGKPQDSVSFKVNGVELNLMNEGGACRNNTINLIAFDRKSTQPYAGMYFKWYEAGRRLLCGREPYVINSFTPQELITGNDDISEYVDNIAEGDSVVLFNIGNAGFEDWPDAAITKLGLLGISTNQLADLRNGDAVVIFGRKGSSPGTATIHHAVSPAMSVEVERKITGRFTSGTMESGLIGPAQSWQRFIYRVTEIESQDVFGFTILGIRQDGQADTLQTDSPSGIDLSFIDAAEYPYLKVIFEAGDNINLTSVQLPRWMVLYEPVAEGLIIYRGPRAPEAFLEGETFSRDFGFVNITNKTFPDSLAVRYDLLAQGQSMATPSVLRIAPPSPNDTTWFTLSFSTMGKGGLNDIEAYVNPRIIPERTYDNNLIRIPEHADVLVDETDPVIEVTIDGRSPENDEYVSASPAIVIRLWDENPFLLKQDTLGIRIFLAYPCEGEECEFQPIWFSREDVRWEPANETSDFLVNFTPVLESGEYILKVEAADASGNSSGAEPYEIRFRVEDHESIVVNAAYPNPFFMETNIDVIIAGEQSSYSSYNFYITTVNGKVVTEFASTDGLHIGRNTLRWDGSGSDGRSLPNGLYFYRLLVSGAAEDKEYVGKVILLR